jgi:very-short-patch-repair endonuclease
LVGINDFALHRLNDINWVKTEYVDKKRTALDIASELNIYYGTVIDYCEKYGFSIRSGGNSSQFEEKICKLLDEYSIEYVRRTRKIITPFELDIFIPSKNLGIEVNGIYHHSYCSNETKEEREYHLNKSIKCVDIGIALLHFTDDIIMNKWEIVKSIILNRVGKSDRIMARKCVIRSVKSEEERTFLNENHIQGYIASKINYGLFYENELVSLMTFGSARFGRKEDYEILRFSNKMNTIVVGGATKLFSIFIEERTPNTIISYSDFSFTTGKLYETLGFTKLHLTKPGYFWYGKNKVLSRMATMKHKLLAVLPNFDENKTESENMFINGYRRYWDCGQIVWKWSSGI